MRLLSEFSCGRGWRTGGRTIRRLRRLECAAFRASRRPRAHRPRSRRSGSGSRWGDRRRRLARPRRGLTRGRVGDLPKPLRCNMVPVRFLLSVLVVFALSIAPVRAERPIVDLHRLDAYFALFAGDSNVPWKPTTVRLDTYSSAPVNFAVYQVDPADVLTAGSNARPRAISTRGRRRVASFSFTPPGGYQFQSNEVDVQLGSREGFFIVEARRGDVGEQVWINRTRVGLVSKETPSELILYGSDLGSGRAISRMRVSFVVNNRFVTMYSDAHGIVRWSRSPRPVFALAQWGSSYAFLSLLPQAPLPSTIVGVRTD